MSLKGVTIENSVDLWRIHWIVLNALVTPFFVFFAFIFMGAGLTVGIDYEVSSLVAWVILALTLISPFVALFRNNIIVKAFRRIGPERFVEIPKLLTLILNILGVASVVALFAMFLTPSETLVYPQTIFLLSFSILFFLIPFFQIFGTAITDSGEIRIIFEALLSNLNNYNERQERMKKVFKKFEKKLEKGHIRIPTDKLIYYFNMKLMKSKGITSKNDEYNNVQSVLRDIERWMIDGETQEKFLQKIETIIPKEEFKPIEKTPLLRQLSAISPEYLRILFLIVLAVVILVKYPELVESLIERFMKLG